MTGCRNVRSFQLSKQRMLWKMEYMVEECVFVKTFYQTSSLVTVQQVRLPGV